MPQKLFRVKIYAYQYHADFIVKSADAKLLDELELGAPFNIP